MDGWIESSPASRRRLWVAHGLPAAAALAILAVARWYPFGDRPLVECGFRRWTGRPCPFCGYTRGVQAVARGRWAEAARDCPAAIGVTLALAGWAAVHLGAMTVGRRLRLGPRWRDARTRRTLLVAIIAAVAVNWLWRLCADRLDLVAPRQPCDARWRRSSSATTAVARRPAVPGSGTTVSVMLLSL